MSELKVGELIYVPSGVELIKITSENKKSLREVQIIPTSCCTTREPVNLVVTRISDYKVGVLYKGETWYVSRRDVYNG